MANHHKENVEHPYIPKWAPLDQHPSVVCAICGEETHDISFQEDDMKVTGKDQICIDGKCFNRQTLENALTMLDNYQPPASPKFNAGDIVTPKDGSLSLAGKRFLVLGGSFKRVVTNHYCGVTIDAKKLVFTDGINTWIGKNPVVYQKIVHLGDV